MLNILVSWPRVASSPARLEISISSKYFQQKNINKIFSTIAEVKLPDLPSLPPCPSPWSEISPDFTVLSLVEIHQDCALIGWILMLLTIALLSYIDTAQGTQSPLLGAFLVFHCVFMA